MRRGRPELSLRWRLVLLFATLATVVALAPLVYLPRALEAQSRRWAERRCLDVARAVAGAAVAAVDFEDARTATEVLAGLETTKRARYAVLLRRSGARLAGWGEPPPEAPLAPGASGDVVHGAGILQVRVEVPTPSGGAGALIVGFTLDELAERRTEAQQLVARTSLVVLAAAIVAAFVIGSLLLRPLRRVVAVAARIARGDDSAAADLGEVGRGGETGEVAHALEGVVERLRRLNASLEQRVEKRTRDLATANEELAARLAELKQAQAQLVVADRRLATGRLAAGAAHEINNPLAYVVSNLSWVSDAVANLRDALHAAGLEGFAARADLAEMLDALAHARDGASRIAHIVRGLRAFSHSDGDERAPVRLDEAMSAAIDMAAPELRHRARVERDFGPGPMVAASSVRLTQVFLNLLVNAAHAIPEGAGDRHAVRVTIGTDGDGSAFAEVTDTGTGIAPEVMDRLFDPFFTTKPVGQGTGLGLSISQGIVTSLGGRITVASELGRGSTFRVTLPPLSGAPAVTPAPDPPAPAPPRRGRVLIVDDEPLVGAAVRRGLGREHDVEVVTSGEEALERMRCGARYDLVLCDIVMPRLTGPQLAAELERTIPGQAEALVFMTGGAYTEGTMRRFVEEHAARVLDKPLDPEMLRRLVHARVAS